MRIQHIKSHTAICARQRRRCTPHKTNCWRSHASALAHTGTQSRRHTSKHTHPACFFPHADCLCCTSHLQRPTLRLARRSVQNHQQHQATCDKSSKHPVHETLLLPAASDNTAHSAQGIHCQRHRARPVSARGHNSSPNSACGSQSAQCSARHTPSACKKQACRSKGSVTPCQIRRQGKQNTLLAPMYTPSRTDARANRADTQTAPSLLQQHRAY